MSETIIYEVIISSDVPRWWVIECCFETEHGEWGIISRPVLE
jgi:hypothetical protein